MRHHFSKYPLSSVLNRSWGSESQNSLQFHPDFGPETWGLTRLTGVVEVTIDEKKVKEAAEWDGLKGYVTNSSLSPKDVIENYRHLWQIEKAFRISKTDLRVRPIHHYRRKRIEAHICIAFVAYTLYKELERLLEKYKAGFSPKRATELTHTMYEIECEMPGSIEPNKIILKMDQEQQVLLDIIQKL